MGDEATKLMVENISKNMSDVDEYPAMMRMHTRCVSILSNMWGAQKGEKSVGTATTGKISSVGHAAISLQSFVLTFGRIFGGHPPWRLGNEAALAGEAPCRGQGYLQA